MIVIIITAIAIYFSYQIFSRLLMEKIVDSAISNMREISKHDEQSMVSGLEHRWLDIEGVSKEIRQNKYSTTSKSRNYKLSRSCFDYRYRKNF